MTQYFKEFEDQAEGAALIAAGAGAAAGASLAAVAEVMGLAVGGTAVAIGAAPFVTLGAVAGLAVYGLTKFLSRSDEETVITSLHASSVDNGASSVEVSEELLSSLETFCLYANADLVILNPDGYDLCDE